MKQSSVYNYQNISRSFVIYVVNFLDFNQLSALASMKNVKRVKKLGRCVKSMCNLSIQTSDILNVRYFPFALAFVKSYWLNR